VDRLKSLSIAADYSQLLLSLGAGVKRLVSQVPNLFLRASTEMEMHLEARMCLRGTS